jgi:ribosomal protein S18 acetylase RimI-like enzyme
MEVLEIRHVNDTIAELVALFRVDLRSYKGIGSELDLEAGRAEMEGYISSGFPSFVASIKGANVGYLVCRVDSGVVWVESLFVKKAYRRHGIASALHRKAEDIASSFGGDTVYNYVHPNNHGMINFLRQRGYTVLNLIEIRKPHKDEHFTQSISVGEHDFDY